MLSGNLSFDIYTALVRPEIVIVIFPPLVFHIFHCLIQCPEVLILVIAPGVLIVLILHTKIIRYDNDPVLEKLLQNKIGVLFDVGHIIEPAFQVFFIEPAYSPGDSFEKKLGVKFPDVAGHGARSKSQA